MSSSSSSATTVTNPHRLAKYKDRKEYLLKLSVIPVLICVIAFGRAAVYRAIQYTNSECQSYGWYSSSSGEFTCDHKPLDFHAKCALGWLATFAIQTGLLMIGGKAAAYHKYVGRVGMIVAFINAGGMFWLSIHELLYPMEETDRPSDFTPFMFLVAIKLTLCLILSLKSLAVIPALTTTGTTKVQASTQSQERDVEQHMIWMFRGFITSFTTPVIRFYPLVLRTLAGQECFESHRHKMVMGAMFVSELSSAWVYYLAQTKTQPVFWDTFMKLQLMTLIFSSLKEFWFASEHGTFISGMAECAMERFQ